MNRNLVTPFLLSLAFAGVVNAQRISTPLETIANPSEAQVKQ
jgi:hypothetical protein